MQTHNITRKNPNKKSRQVGRGTTRGKTSGRGTKGQRARAGHKIRPAMRDIIKKLPKRRGYGKNRARGVYSERPRPAEANIISLQKNFESGALITPAILVEKGIIKKVSGKIPAVKILARGELDKKFTISGCTLSAAAKKKIE